MSDTIDRARHIIEERIHELEAEAKKLRDALAKLSHRDGQPSSAQPSRRTKRRAKPGEREKQLLASIEEHPDYSPSEHAKAIKVSPTQVYGLASKLQAEGKIAKTATGTYTIKKPKARAA